MGHKLRAFPPPWSVGCCAKVCWRPEAVDGAAASSSAAAASAAILLILISNCSLFTIKRTTSSPRALLACLLYGSTAIKKVGQEDKKVCADAFTLLISVERCRYGLV